MTKIIDKDYYKEWRQNAKIIDCPCCKSFKFCYKNQHLKSKNHLRYLKYQYNAEYLNLIELKKNNRNDKNLIRKVNRKIKIKYPI